MAGRGRGRGRGGLSFNVEALHIQRGDIISKPGLHPPPLFPPLVHKPIPLQDSTPSEKTMIELKQEFLEKFRQSPFYLTMDEKKHEIERYSDRYQSNQQEQKEKWVPDWSMFPAELKPKKRKAQSTGRPNLKAARRTLGTDDVLSKLENLEKSTLAENAGNEEGDEEEEEKEEEDREGDEEEENDEGDEEEETDYNVNYFDNGENYGDDDDEDDEPVYS
ncbi:hypothetical protein V1264_001827 [Littorina saxatilis]|uniref:DNA-directed RNA polymerase III subunit n=2 Tax=Littorina saxatilis TaxID=31220 RepID=A0AAN9C2C7_9CAEN